jgi:hypothetical protein
MKASLPSVLFVAGLALLAGCGPRGAEERNQQNAVEAEDDIVDIPQTVEQLAPGTTPMAERSAVLGFLNKRNGLSRDLTLRPGQAIRIGDAIVRLRACETSAPWEVQRLTGAFVQLDVRNSQDQMQRVFSGWLYKETPSLNVVEHPIYDVWPKSCEMTHPGGGEPAPSPANEAARPASSRSSAPKSAGTSAPATQTGPEPGEAPAEETTEPTAAESN